MAAYFQNFLGNFKRFVGKGSYLGIDIGTTSIKIAEISHSADQPRLINYAILESFASLERPNSAIQASSLKISETETSEMLKSMVAKAKFSSKDAIVSLPIFSVFTTFIELPAMSEIDTGKAMTFQITQHIPLPLSEVAIEWLKIGEREDEQGFTKQQFFLIAAPNEQVNRYRNIFKMAGLQLRAVEAESLSLVRSLLVKESPTTLIVDVGSHSTNIVVAEQNFIKHNSQTDFAGYSLTKAIAGGLNINIRRAEELKRRKGLLGTGGEYELSTLTIPFIDVIIKEVKQVKEKYEKNFPQSPVKRLILAGGGGNMLGIDQYFEKEIGLPIIIASPFSHIDYPLPIEPLIKELRALLPVAIGLGIKGE